MDTPIRNAGFQSATDIGTPSTTTSGSGVCGHCGASLSGHEGLEQFLGKLGITEEMINNLKTSMQHVDVEQYLNTAREYLKTGTNKATSYAKENPAKVAAGVAVLAVGAGLLLSALKRD